MHHYKMWECWELLYLWSHLEKTHLAEKILQNVTTNSAKHKETMAPIAI